MSSRSLDLFSRACEIPALPALIVGGEPALRVMTAPFAVVGSDPRCDLVIDDESVSPRHSYFQAIGSRVLSIRLGGKRGGGGVHEPSPACWVDPGQGIRVGSRVIRLDGGPAGPRDPEGPGSAVVGEVAEQPLLSLPMPRIALDFMTNHIQTHWRMRRAVALVGAAPECTVRLNGAGVSRYHCALVLTGQGLWVVDLLGQLEASSEDVTLVNGTPVRFARVDPGDVLRVGGVSVRVRHVTAPARRACPAQPVRAEAPTATGGGVETAVGGSAKGPAESPAKASDREMETLRHQYEDQIAEQVEQHRVEVETLRDEIEALRDQIERLRSAAGPRRRRQARRKPDHRPSTVEGPWPRTASIRTLGSATRRLRSATRPPADHPLHSGGTPPETSPVVLTLAVPGFVPVSLASRITDRVTTAVI